MPNINVELTDEEYFRLVADKSRQKCREWREYLMKGCKEHEKK